MPNYTVVGNTIEHGQDVVSGFATYETALKQVKVMQQVVRIGKKNGGIKAYASFIIIGNDPTGVACGFITVIAGDEADIVDAVAAPLELGNVV